MNAVQNITLAGIEQLQAGESTYTCLELVFVDNRCDVQTKAGFAIGTIPKRQHKVLQRCHSSENLEYKALVLLDDFERSMNRVQKTARSSNHQCTINIQVFGAREIADSIGKVLSQERLFLQHPSPLLHGAMYENPQYLSLVGSTLPNGALLPQLSCEIMGAESKLNDPTIELVEEVDKDEIEGLMSAMNGVVEHNYLEHVRIDKRIHSILYR